MGVFRKNYDKPGPGVYKSTPQKRPFFLFWDIFGRKFWKIVQVNLLFLLFSIPIVTIGPATAAYTYVLRNFAREEHAFVWWDFFEAFKSNFKQSFFAGIIDIIVTAIFVYDGVFYFSTRAEAWTTGKYFLLVFSLTTLIIAASVRYYVYTIMVTFDMKLRYVYKDALIFSIIGIKKNLAAFFINLCAVGILLGLLILLAFKLTNGILFMLGLFAIGVVAVFLLPAFMRLTGIFWTYPIIDKYMIKKTQENEEKLPKLPKYSQINEDDDDDDGEIIFHDEVR